MNKSGNLFSSGSLTSRLIILLAHLLRGGFSLKNHFPDAILNAYPKAVKLAARETRLPARTFPENCDYSVVQLLDEDFYPDAAHFANDNLHRKDAETAETAE